MAAGSPIWMNATLEFYHELFFNLFFATYSMLLVEHLLSISVTQRSNDSFPEVLPASTVKLLKHTYWTKSLINALFCLV